MTDRSSVIEALEQAIPFMRVQGYDIVALIMRDALERLKAEETRRKNMLHSWNMIKHSVLETATNNADAGNEDLCKLLTWVANMMNQQEAKWDG